MSIYKNIELVEFLSMTPVRTGNVDYKEQLYDAIFGLDWELVWDKFMGATFTANQIWDSHINLNNGHKGPKITIRGNNCRSGVLNEFI